MSETTDPRQQAAGKRRAREERIRRLRMRIAAVAIALFVAVWTGLYVQLVSGHDPALASEAGTVATQSADPEVTTEDDGWSDEDAWSDGTASSDGGDVAEDTSQASSEPAAVTTGQS